MRGEVKSPLGRRRANGGARGVRVTSSARTERKPRERSRKGIQSIETGFRILDLLVNAGRPLPLREIAAGTGLPPSNVHFYLVSLVATGAVRQDAKGRSYGLGPYALRLGIAGLEQFDFFHDSRTALLELASEVGHSAFLGVWGNHGPTIVYRVDGPQSRAVFELRVGSVLPVLRSALGKNLLAHLPESMTQPFVDRELADIAAMSPAQKNPDVPYSRHQLATMLEEIRRTGLSRGRRTLLSDYTAISAPVFDYSGAIIAGITVMGPVGVLDDSLDGPASRLLLRFTQRISSEAGYRGSEPDKRSARSPSTKERRQDA